MHEVEDKKEFLDCGIVSSRDLLAKYLMLGFGMIVDGYKRLKCKKVLKAMRFLFSGSIIRGFISSIYLTILVNQIFFKKDEQRLFPASDL